MKNTNLQILKEIGEMAKVQTLLMDSVKTQKEQFNGTASKIDSLVKCQTEIRQDLKEVKGELAGDDFGNIGLVKDHKALKTNHYELARKQEIMETKIWTTKRLAIGFGSLITLLLAILTYLAL